MSVLSFNVAYATTLEGVLPLTPDMTIYAEDLGFCQHCVDIVGSCYPCLQTTQRVFTDNQLLNQVADGYYLISYGEGNQPGVWYIFEGYPQSGGYYNGVE